MHIHITDIICSTHRYILHILYISHLSVAFLPYIKTDLHFSQKNSKFKCGITELCDITELRDITELHNIELCNLPSGPIHSSDCIITSTVTYTKRHLKTILHSSNYYSYII